jgi:hypothetical protein
MLTAAYLPNGFSDQTPMLLPLLLADSSLQVLDLGHALTDENDQCDPLNAGQLNRAMDQIERVQRRRQGEFVPPPVNARVLLEK